METHMRNGFYLIYFYSIVYMNVCKQINNIFNHHHGKVYTTPEPLPIQTL
jgi:hypothetical protein